MFFFHGDGEGVENIRWRAQQHPMSLDDFFCLESMIITVFFFDRTYICKKPPV